MKVIKVTFQTCTQNNFLPLLMWRREGGGHLSFEPPFFTKTKKLASVIGTQLTAPICKINLPLVLRLKSARCSSKVTSKIYHMRILFDWLG